MSNVIRGNFRHNFTPAQVFNNLFRLKGIESSIEGEKNLVAKRLQIASGAKPTTGFMRALFVQKRRRGMELL